MTRSSAPSVGEGPDALTSEAGAWFARMHSDQVTSEDEAAFVEWLDADPAHGEVYREISAMWSGIGALQADPAMRDILRELSPKVRAPLASRRHFLLWGGSAAAAAGAAGLIGWQFLLAPRAYATGFGEQRRVALADGSTLTLNTETQVRVDFSQTERRIWLDRGQAHFIVAHDAARPFRVFAGNEEVRALGTRFEVRRDGARMRVTLEEGAVAIFRDGQAQQVTTAPGARAEAVLRPGQQAVVAQANIEVATVDTQRVLAWRFGQMDLDAQPLSEAVAEINRYNTRQIILEDPAIASMPISGLFQTGSPEAFVDAVSRVLPVEIVNQDDGVIRLREAQAAH